MYNFIKKYGVVLSIFGGIVFIFVGILLLWKGITIWATSFLQFGSALLGAGLGAIASSIQGNDLNENINNYGSSLKKHILDYGGSLKNDILDMVRYRNNDSFDNENVSGYAGIYYMYHVTKIRSGLTWRRTKLELKSGIAHGRLVSKTESVYEKDEPRNYNNFGYIKKDNMRFMICFERAGNRSQEEASSIYIFPRFGVDNEEKIWPGIAVFQTFVGNDCIGQCLLSCKSLIDDDSNAKINITESVDNEKFDHLNEIWIREMGQSNCIILPTIFNPQ